MWMMETKVREELYLEEKWEAMLGLARYDVCILESVFH